MAQFDPSKEDVDTVLKELDKADKAERKRILAAEVSGKKRKTILEPNGIDPDARYDSTGRPLYPWEVTGKDMADADRNPEAEESDEAREAREAQLAADEATATPQLGSTPAGSGTPAAPRSGTTVTGSTTATTAGSTTATT